MGEAGRTFDGLIAYTLDMENSFDIPRATTIFSTEPREAEDPLCSEIVWRYRELLKRLYMNDPLVIENYTLEPGGCILVCSSPSTVTINRNPIDTSWFPADWLDTLDTRHWWAVRLY